MIPLLESMSFLKKERLNNPLDKFLEKTFLTLNSIEILNSKPTLICDADEVIFDFMNEFLTFLKKKLSFNWASYALNGNIIKKDKKPLDEKAVK